MKTIEINGVRLSENALEELRSWQSDAGNEYPLPKYLIGRIGEIKDFLIEILSDIPENDGKEVTGYLICLQMIQQSIKKLNS